MKKNVSSLELAALVNELQFLVRGKIPHIYHPQEKELLLHIHVPNKGKQLLKIVSGKFLCLTETKETTLKPSSFCMQLRKYLDNAFIKGLYQKDSERIAVFELEKKEKYFLIVELFSKGNVVLTDEHYKIIGVLEQQIWKDRTVKVSEKYIFPRPGVDWKQISEQDFWGVLNKSDKKNIATALATDIGLGGVYAEEMCKRTLLDKNKLPREVSDGDLKLLFDALKEMLRLIEKPRGYVYPENTTPFRLTGETVLKELPSYNEAISKIIFVEKSSPYEQKIRSVDNMIKQQQETIKKLNDDIEVNTKRGKLIYEKYLPLQQLLEIVKEMRKHKEWKEIERELKKEKKIKTVDLKNKRVVIDL